MNDAGESRNSLRVLRETLKIVARRRTIVLAVVLLVWVYGVTEHALVPATYRTTIKLRVEPSPPPIVGLEQNLSAPFDPTFVMRQCALIRSPAILSAVVNELRLAQRWGITEDAAVSQLGKSMLARPTHEGDLLMLEAAAANPALAVTIGDATVAAFGQELIEHARRPALQMLDRLRAQEELQDKRLEAARQKTRQESLARAADPARAKPDDAGVQQLRQSLTNAQSDLAAVSGRIDAVAQAANRRDPTPAASLIKDAQADALVAKIEALAVDLSVLRAEYGPEHSTVQAREIAQVELVNRVRDRVSTALQSMSVERNSLRDRCATLAAQLAEMPTAPENSQDQSYRTAQRDEQLQERILEQTRQRIQQVSFGLEIPFSPVQIVERPARGTLSYYGRISDNPAILAAISLLAAFATALLVDRWRARVATGEEASQLLNAPLLANLEDTLRLLGERESQSAQLEAYRSILNRLEFAAGQSGIRSLAITSTMRGEGRTLVAANLACLFAARGRRTLLVEADLARPALASLLGAEPGPGLLDFIDGRASLDQLVAPTDLDGVWLVTAGSRGESVAPTPLQFTQFARSMRDQFDVVIYDTAPLLESSDAALIAREAGSAVMLVRSDFVSEHHLIRANELLNHAGSSVLGVVFNRAPDAQAVRSTGGVAPAPLRFRIARHRIAQSRLQPRPLRGAA